MDIKLTEEEIKKVWLDFGCSNVAETSLSVDIATAFLAAQRRKIREWGDSPCPHDHLTNPNRPKHACDVCWEELKS
jgi:hypothetical protein